MGRCVLFGDFSLALMSALMPLNMASISRESSANIASSISQVLVRNTRLVFDH